MSKIKNQRLELPSIEDKKKNKYPPLSDKTKDKAEGWLKTIRTLNTDVGQ